MKSPELFDDSLASEILRGGRAIGEFLGLEEKVALYGLSKGLIPGRKRGAKWESTRSELRRDYLGYVASQK
jgi:hypothetical protein